MAGWTFGKGEDRWEPRRSPGSSGSETSWDVRGVSWITSSIDCRDTELASVVLAPSWAKVGSGLEPDQVLVAAGGAALPAPPAAPGLSAYPVSNSRLKELTSIAPLDPEIELASSPDVVCSKSPSVFEKGFGGALGNV